MLVWAYQHGMFPMAEPRTGRIGWYSPDPRGIIPLDAFHVPHSLRRTVRRQPFRITTDRAFERVIRACAQPRPDHGQTWINETIVSGYLALHESGLAHSVEVWMSGPGAAGRTAERLAGGLYGVALRGAFFGESMFSRATDASKVCLVHLVEHLRGRGFALLDAQFTTAHLARFGAIDVPRAEYLRRLRLALRLAVCW
jgi:leucyl/phenylalanyl-tRNA--protein transferase